MIKKTLFVVCIGIFFLYLEHKKYQHRITRITKWSKCHRIRSLGSAYRLTATLCLPAATLGCLGCLACLGLAFPCEHKKHSDRLYFRKKSNNVWESFVMMASLFTIIEGSTALLRASCSSLSSPLVATQTKVAILFNSPHKARVFPKTLKKNPWSLTNTSNKTRIIKGASINGYLA